MLSAAIGTKILQQYLDTMFVIFWVLIIIIGWEIVEYIFEIKFKPFKDTPYKTFEIWWYDTLGDSLGAFLIMIIMIIQGDVYEFYK